MGSDFKSFDLLTKIVMAIFLILNVARKDWKNKQKVRNFENEMAAYDRYVL